MRYIRMIVLFGALIWLAVSSPVLAQEDRPQNTTDGVTVFTRYPVQEIAIGDSVTFELTLRTETNAQVVRLETQDLPKGWTATFKGEGRIIQAAYIEPDNETSVDLRIEPTRDSKAGSHRFSVNVKGQGGNSSFPLELVIQDKLPPNLVFDVDLPTLRGNPETAFRYNATLKNEGDEDLSVNLVANAPRGFQVDFKLSGQSVTSIPIAADETKNLSIEAQALPELPAGQYEIEVLAQGGDVQATVKLVADVTGQSNIAVTTADGRLSGQAYTNKTTPFKLFVQNSGSAPARNIQLNASPPTGWKVEFEPKQIPEIAGKGIAEVTANVKPADQTIAGDYMLTFTARPEDGASKSAEFRVTILTSTLWGIVGIALIAIAVVVVGLAVARFGRR